MTLEIGVILTVLIQTTTIAWWASGITQMVKRHDGDLRDLKSQLDSKAGDPRESAAGRALLDRIERLEKDKD